MASVTQQDVHTGNTVYLMVNGKTIGRAQSVSAEISYGTTGVYEIGSIMPQEHVYLQYEGSLTLERFRMKRESLDQLGLTALGEDILQKDVIDIVVMDNLTKQVVVSYRGCSAQDLNIEVTANEIMSENSTWQFLQAANVSA